MLIGCAVHDANVGGSAASEWEWAARAAAVDHSLNDEVWDGDRNINRNFVERIEEALLSRIERGGLK